LSALWPLPAVQPREFPKQSSWLQVVSHLDPKYGGIAALLPMFCEAAEAEGARSPVVGFCDQQEYRKNAAYPRWDVTCVNADRFRWMFDPKQRGHLKEVIRRADGVHIHGIWETHCAIGADLAQTCRRPYVLSAHGMLERWALQHKRLKKALYATLVETNNLRKAHCLRALTRAEVSDYRRIGLTNPVAVVPGGVAIPAGASPTMFIESHPTLAGKRVVLFLGRLHHKKGLTLLLRAWANCAASFGDAHLVIAGPDLDGTCVKLESMVDELGIRRTVTFPGMLVGPMKWSALAAASVFALPSFSEGFSVAVLEALGMSIPVIVTRRCNIPEVAEHGCGWMIEPEQAALEAALQESLRLPTLELQGIGERGRALVQSRYTWSVVGKQMAEVYQWVLGGPRPVSTQVYYQ
jgi:glycosyltransferase involved in cell wall biosynthesis